MFISLKWKISGILAISNLALGLVLILVLNSRIADNLLKELIERGRTIAMNLSQYSAEKILTNDVVGLKDLITDNRNFESVSYLMIYDSEGNIISDTFNEQIPEALTVSNFDSLNLKQDAALIQYGEENYAYDIWVGVEDGYLGYIRIGMKRDYVVKSVQETTMIVLISIAVVTFIGIIIVLFLANRIIRPILFLTKSANDISRGNLDKRVRVKTNDEINQLAQALERLRESVKIALERLKKHQTLRM
jgi:HAMP domain-containing protein